MKAADLPLPGLLLGAYPERRLPRPSAWRTTREWAARVGA